MPTPSRVISIRVKPHGQEFVATIIGSRIDGTSVGGSDQRPPRLVQRLGVSEFTAVKEALYALLVSDLASGTDWKSPDMRALLRDLLEDAQLVDDPNGYYGYLVAPGIIDALKEAIK